MEAAASSNDRAVPANYIVRVLPSDVLKMVFETLPASNRFISPVCRHFRDLHADAVGKQKNNKTYKYSISSEDALELVLNEAFDGYSLYMPYEDYEEQDNGNSRLNGLSIIGAGSGRLDWVERGGVYNEHTREAAAKGGQLRILKWLHEQDCPLDTSTCWGAANGGHLEVLKWLREKGYPWDCRTCMEAAKGGHLEVLQWLRKEGCPWDEKTCLGAAEGRHLDMLQWLRKEGCPWDWSTSYSAAQNKHLEVLRWAIENGCAYDQGNIRHFITDLDFLEWFEGYVPTDANGCPAAAAFSPCIVVIVVVVAVCLPVLLGVVALQRDEQVSRNFVHPLPVAQMLQSEDE